MVIFAIIVNVILVIEAIYDWYSRVYLKKVASHSVSFIIDAIIHVVAAYTLFENPIGWIVLSAGYHWLVFDILFNKINGWKWNNYGTSSWMDRQLSKLGKFHLLPKLLFIILGIVLIKFIKI